MSCHRVVLSAALSLVAFPLALSAQGLGIDHKPVGCIVAGKFPRFDACLIPENQVSRARLYFKPEDASIWYYVAMQRETPCFTGVLPKPSKKLVGKKVLYYIDTADRQFVESRTPDTTAEIVGSELGCKKEVPIATPLSNASVAVFPNMPVGFGTAGLATGTVAAIGVGSAAAIGGGVALATSGGGGGSTPTPEPPPPPPPPPGPRDVPPTTPPVEPPPPPTGENQPPIPDFRVNPDPPEGNPPLEVTFNMCRSTDPDDDELRFSYEFGDGDTFRGNCRATHVYGSSGPASPVATLCVTDGQRGHDRCQTFNVKVRSTCASDTKPPSVSLDPVDGRTFPIIVGAKASDASGIVSVQFFAEEVEGPTEPIGSDTSAPFSILWDPDVSCSTFFLTAKARDGCGKEATSEHQEVRVDRDCFTESGDASVAATLLTSDLRLAGGHGQVTLNGRGSLPAGDAPVRAAVSVEAGENLVEAIVVQGAGASGTWRFELSRLEPGSLRVDAGEVAQIGEGAVVFRLSGRAGERVAFRFIGRPEPGSEGRTKRSGCPL